MVDQVELRWQPIESAPREPQRTILLARFVGSPYGWVLGAGYFNPTKGSFVGEPLDSLHKGFTFDRATHWMRCQIPRTPTTPERSDDVP